MDKMISTDGHTLDYKLPELRFLRLAAVLIDVIDTVHETRWPKIFPNIINQGECECPVQYSKDRDNK